MARARSVAESTDFCDITFMDFQFTPAAWRALAKAAQWSGCSESSEVSGPALLLGLLAEPECRAAIMLQRRGIDVAAILGRWPDLQRQEPPTAGPLGEEVGSCPNSTPPEGLPPLSADVETSLAVSSDRLSELPKPLEMATEHLLLGLAAGEHETALWLCQMGVDPDLLAAEVYRQYGVSPDPLPLDDVEPIELENSHGGSTAAGDAEVTPQDMAQVTPRKLAPHEQIRVLRVIDAAANRGREGLRAVEDYARFVLDDSHLTGELKQLRHQLAEVLAHIPLQHRLAAREAQADVGTTLTTPSEEYRPDATSVVTANFTRLQESLRSLEEFGKVLNPGIAEDLEQLRYRAYTLQRAVEITRSSRENLSDARLYVLVDGRPSEEDFRKLVGPLIEAGVHVIQLRDKQLDDRSLLQRARVLRRMTLSTKTLFVMNDRADLAALARADGVHVGQHELTVKDARTMVGPDALIGVSTHSIEQARQAVLDGANYLGVGPTFPSGTKHFDEFPGLDFLRAVAAEIRLPAFAIGGIDGENLPEVLATGVRRIAVGGAVTGGVDSAVAAGKLLATLRG